MRSQNPTPPSSPVHSPRTTHRLWGCSVSSPRNARAASSRSQTAYFWSTLISWNVAQSASLPLRELEPLPRSRPSVLLPLHRARIAREESGLLQRRPVLRVQLRQRPADPVPDGPRLSRQPSAADVDGDVHLVQLLHHLERLLEDHLAGVAPEVLVEGAVVDD